MEETKNQFDTIQEEEEENSAKWVTHYSSDHQILLVGEGDFSFSLSLAKSFGSAANIVASSLNSYGQRGKLMNENERYLLESHCSRVQNPNDLSHVDNVTKMYKNAKSNLDDLHKLGACLLHGVDATKMKLHSDLKMRRFDRVIFNFPHAGFHGREDSTSLIKMHKALVLGFFNNASRMLRANGEIHVSHKTTAPFTHWKIENLASQCFLTLIECAEFNREDYPGYNNKRGDSYRCDEPFPLGKCCTYKFVYIPKAKRKRTKTRKQMMVSRQQIDLPIEEIENDVEQLPTSAHFNYYPETSHFLNMKEETSILASTNRRTSITGGHLSSMAEVHGRGPPSGGYSALSMSLGPPRRLQPMEPLQSLQQWSASANVRYSMTDHVRTMETVPSPLDPRILQPMQPLQTLQPWSIPTDVRYSLTYHVRTTENFRVSLDARNERYWVNGGKSNYFQEEHGRRMHTTVPLCARNEGYYRVYGGCSNYWQQEHCRTTNQSACYTLDGVRSDFDRFIAEVPGRSVQSELHRMNTLMSDRRRVFVHS